MPIPGAHIETVETRWSQHIDRMFDTPESKQFAPDPHIWLAYLFGTQSRQGHFQPPHGKATDTAAHAFVNQSRWIARCPYCQHSAQHVSHDDPWFYCATCHNRANGHKSIPVKWPNDKHHIDAILVERPDKATRNWAPHETAQDLAAENEEHGVALFGGGQD